ncbi:DUF5305 family protein [Micromonosporaceae bacterium Da 78-11]
MARQGGSWATAVTVAKAIERLPSVLRAAAVLVAVLMGLGIALGILGWMRPIAVVQAADAAGPGQSMTYSYSAKVPSSPAYDGTTVTSPEPIFRKLAQKVDVHLRYVGHPGSLAVTVDLSDGSGWHTTMQIAPAKKFTGDSYDVTVALDLDVFDKRAQAAADAIGTRPGPLVIALESRVTATGEQAFAAPLTFNLAPLALTLAKGAGSLVVDSSTPTAGATVVPRTIEVLDHPIMTAAGARAYAVLLLLGALLGAVAIALVARRDTPVRTRAEIERRHPQLLVHVEPMASPPGKPVVNVDNFPALVKLAERYGQMILTWSRPDADDFVVRDEGITYRYRSPLDGAPTGPDVTAELVDVEAPTRRRRAATKTVLTGTEDRPGSHRYP